LPPGDYNVTALIDFSGPAFSQTPPLAFTIEDTETLVCSIFVDGSSPSRCVRDAPADTDGIDSGMEDAGPNNGDGNLDGFADSAQTHVASTADPSGRYVTIAAPSGAYPLSNVTTSDPGTLPPPPAGITGESAVIGFEVAVTSLGETIDVDVYLAGPLGEIDGYWKYDTSTGWFDATALATFTPVGDGRIRARLTLTDGGLGDEDGEANGVIVDPGLFTTRGPYRVTIFSPVEIPGSLHTVRQGTTVPFVFRVEDSSDRAVLRDVVGAATSVTVPCPRGVPRPIPTPAILPNTTSNLGDGRWYVGWPATRSMKGTCQRVAIALDDGTTVGAIIKVI
jgi:hypothetical protein